jgi:hypothetical protein
MVINKKKLTYIVNIVGWMASLPETNTTTRAHHLFEDVQWGS